MATERVDSIDFDIDHATALLARTPPTLRAWLEGLPEEWLRTPEVDGSWSAHDAVGHLIHGEKTDWVPRLRQILDGRGHVPFEPFDREAMRSEPDRDTAALLAELAELRAANLRTLAELGIGPDRNDDPGTHPDLGPVTLRQLLATWVTHDLTHLAQVGRILAKHYRHEVGPWRAFLPLLDREIGGS